MKAFFQNILRKEDSPSAPLALPDDVGGGESAGANPEILGRTEEARGPDPAALVLEVDDFLARIPPHLLKAGEVDSRRPLRFDVGEVAGRLNRGISTIPLAVLLDAAPEIFSDEALAHADLEIRFPWRKVLALINESAAAAKAGEKTLAQRLRAGLEADRKPAGGKAQETGGGSVRQKPAQAGLGATKGSDAERSATEATSSRAAMVDSSHPVVSQIVSQREAIPPAAPDFAPPLAELPDSTAEMAPVPGARPPEANGVLTEPADRAGEAVRPIPDLMDLSTAASIAPTQAEASSHPRTSVADPLPDRAPLAAVDAENVARIAELEAQLKGLTARHQSEISALRTESSRATERVRSEAARQGSELVARLALEQKEIAAQKEAQMAGRDAEEKALLILQQNELRKLVVERDAALAGKDEELLQLRDEHRQELNTLLLDLDRALRDREVIALRLEEAGLLAKRPAPANSELETVLAARDAEIAALRETGARAAIETAAHAATQAAELEMQGRVTAQLEADIAQYRMRIKSVLLERDALAALAAMAKIERAEPAKPPISAKSEIGSGAAGASSIATAGRTMPRKF